MIPILDSKRQYAQIGAEVEKAVCEVLRSGSYILGPNTKALEKELADFILLPTSFIRLPVSSIDISLKSLKFV